MSFGIGEFDRAPREVPRIAAALPYPPDVCSLLFARLRCSPRGPSSAGLIVVPGEYSGGVGQRHNFLDRSSKTARAAAGKIRPRGAGIRHEEGIVRKRSVTDEIGYRCECMTRREHDAGFNIADLEALAVRKQTIPLRSVRRKVRPVIGLLPELLDLTDTISNRRRRARFLLQVMSCRKMVCMGMRIENP